MHYQLSRPFDAALRARLSWPVAEATMPPKNNAASFDPNLRHSPAYRSMEAEAIPAAVLEQLGRDSLNRIHLNAAVEKRQ